jgi:TonB family protein
MQMPAFRIARTALFVCLSAGRIAAQTPGAPGADGVYRVGDGVSAPALISKMEPAYPDTARNLRADGVVGLSAVVEPDGTASDFRVTKSLGYGEVRFPPLQNPIPDRWVSGPMEFSVESGVTPPVVKGGTMPKPDGKLGYEHLVLGFTVDASGTVGNIHAVSGVPATARLLTKYVTTWKFLPAMTGRQPVEATGTVSFSRGSEDRDTHNAAGLPEKIYVKGDGISDPSILKKVRPNYSEAARVNKIQGGVVLGIVIDTAGDVVNFTVLKGIGFGLDEQAIEAIVNWKFNPARKDGKPVASKATVDINFVAM